MISKRSLNHTLIRLIEFALIFIGWLLLSGHFDALLISLGLGSSLLVFYFYQKMELAGSENEIIIRRLPSLVKYWCWLIKQILTANLHVAQLIFQPREALSPNLLFVRTDGMSEMEQVILANSITLTPGTITLFVRNNYLLVHSLTAQSAASVTSGLMQKRVQSIFNDPKPVSPDQPPQPDR